MANPDYTTTPVINRRTVITAAACAATVSGLAVLASADAFEERLEAVLCGLEGNGYVVQVCTHNGVPQGLFTSLPDDPLPWEMDAPLFAERDKLWKQDKARFLAHLIRSGRESRT